MSKPVSIAIFEADNRLVGFSIPSVHDVLKEQSERMSDYMDKFLYGSGITRKRLRGGSFGAMPLQGPVYAANLLKKKYQGEAVDIMVYVPGISGQAMSLDGVRNIIRRSDIVVVSSLSINSWAQMEIIRIAREESKKAIATGVHAWWHETAKGLLGRDQEGNPIKIPESRHDNYNERLVNFPGADYVIQHNHYNAFLELVELIRQGADCPGTVKSIMGVGYCDDQGNVRGLSEVAGDMIVPPMPDVVYDVKVIDGYDTKLKITASTGSEQGCINACDFCQIKQFMRNTFVYNPPTRLYDNLKALFDAGLLKGRFNPVRGSLGNSLFFTDDCPLLGGPLEKDIPFDYVEFSKILDYIGALQLKSKKKIAGNSPVIKMPREVVAYIQSRNPALLKRMIYLGLTYTEGGEPVSRNREPVNLHGASWAEAVGALQDVAATRVDNLKQRPFAGKNRQNAAPVEKMGAQLRKNYVEFTKMLDEIEQFERDYNCKPSFSIEMSVRAVNYLNAQNPSALRRMHDLGFDMIEVGFEDIIHKDTEGIAGFVKSIYEESKEAVNAMRQAGLVIFAMLICPAEVYELGDAKKTAEKALELGINCIQIFSEQALEGTLSTEKHRQRKSCLYQVANDHFGGPWRNLAYGLAKGEVVTLRPERASMLGMQLDILDATRYFNRLSHHWPLFTKEFRKKGWRTALYGLGLPAFEEAALSRDLLQWLAHTPIRAGKNYFQILSEIDPRWKQEEYTLTLARKFGLQETLRCAD